MSETFEGSSKAMDHLYAIDLVFDFLIKNNIREKYSDNLASMFINCFWFAYGNSNSKNKKKVLKRSTAMLKKMDLGGNHLIDSLRNGAYTNIDGIDPPLYQKAFSELFRIFLNKFGISGSDGVIWKSTSLPDPFDYSNRVATTRWVHDHEWSSGVDRWRTTFDASKNWLDGGFPDGISGGSNMVLKDFQNLLMPGHRFRFFVSFRNMDPMIIFGEINRNERFVWGTTVYDGDDVISISVDVKPEEKSLFIKGYNLSRSVDCSEECKVIKMDMTV